jgi:flagellar biosynthesis protein FliR
MENDLLIAQATLHDIQATLSALETKLWLVYAGVNLMFLFTGIFMSLRQVPNNLHLIFGACYSVASLPAVYTNISNLPMFLLPALSYLAGVWSGGRLKAKLKTQS